MLKSQAPLPTSQNDRVWRQSMRVRVQCTCQAESTTVGRCPSTTQHFHGLGGQRSSSLPGLRMSSSWNCGKAYFCCVIFPACRCFLRQPRQANMWALKHSRSAAQACAPLPSTETDGFCFLSWSSQLLNNGLLPITPSFASLLIWAPFFLYSHLLKWLHGSHTSVWVFSNTYFSYNTYPRPPLASTTCSTMSQPGWAKALSNLNKKVKVFIKVKAIYYKVRLTKN